MKTKTIKLKVTQLENKNQFLIKDNNFIYFQSYDSLVAVYDKKNDIVILGCDWDYSKTTRKHLYIFLSEYCYFNDLYYKKNKKQYIYNCIKNKKIIYDKNMQ